MKVIPPYIEKTISNAEKKVFDLFADDKKLNYWYCLHSLGMSRHISKREGEIDFLIIGAEGIFVIEAKGGRVQRKNGMWLFTDRYGRTTQKKESPFVQARSALYSLREDLTKKFGQSIKNFVFGYGVAFPDITFDVDSPEWSQEIIFDSRNIGEAIDEYISRLSRHWFLRQHTAQKLDYKSVTDIVNYLRGDFETIQPISTTIDESESEILSLTGEQYGALDAMEQNPRIIFSGPAGTGKTLLAIEKARRNHARGIKTLFLCFNRLLGLHLADIVKKEKLSSVTVNTLHQFFYEIISKNGYAKKLQTTNKLKTLYTEVYPEYFTKLWNKEQAYQELIVDEGQDILSKEYISALEAVVVGGFQKGRWTFFVDSEIQKNMFSSFDQDVYAKLMSNAATFRLTVNCRNTKPIALQTEVVTGFPLGKIKKTKGLPVKYLWYKDSRDQASQISIAVNDLLRDGIKAEEITILSPKRYLDSISGSGRLRLNTGFYQLGKDNLSKNEDLLGCGTIQAYKGLENSIVILTDIEDIASMEDKVINYVGFTRPRALLLVSINKKLQKDYEEFFTNVASQVLK